MNLYIAQVCKGGPRGFSHEEGKTRGHAEATPELSDQGWNRVWEECRNFLSVTSKVRKLRAPLKCGPQRRSACARSAVYCLHPWCTQNWQTEGPAVLYTADNWEQRRSWARVCGHLSPYPMPDSPMKARLTQTIVMSLLLSVETIISTLRVIVYCEPTALSNHRQYALIGIPSSQSGSCWNAVPRTVSNTPRGALILPAA